MGLLGLSWFRSRKEKELDIKEKELSIKLKEKLLENRAEIRTLDGEDIPKRLYKKIKFTNDVLTVILNDGSVISKAGATEVDFNKVRSATTDQEITNVVLNKSVEKPKDEISRAIKAASNFDILEKTGDFEREEGALYLKGIKRSLPALLINRFAEIISHSQSSYLYPYSDEQDNAEYKALKKFWMKCCLNPNAQSAEDLYAFLSKHQFKIDEHGNFYAYRRVVSANTADKALVEFVSNTYTKVKAVWKKKPAYYEVFKDDDGHYGITDNISTPGFQSKNNEVIGNLEKLYLDLPNMQEKTYTDNHTRSFDYKVGTVITMPRHKGDDDNSVSCSKGFHAASKEYDYSGFGDTSILLIINPMDVLAVPHGEIGKLRTCRWFFASVLSKDEQHILDEDDFDVTDLGDIFEEKCLEDLEEHIKRGFTEEVQRHTFTLSNISSKDISNIVRKLEIMKETISDRISFVN